MKVHCRCRCCQTRQVLARQPAEYALQHDCRNCGARSWRADRWMNERNVRAATCNCDGYHFPHRRGSLGCKFTPDTQYVHGPVPALLETSPLDAFF